MKFALFPFRKNNRSGIILLVALWILVILSVLAVGLGRRTGVDLSLTKYALSGLKARYMAWAGLMYAIHQIKMDTEDPITSTSDTLYQCGIKLEEGKTPQLIFQKVSLGDGNFEVFYNPFESGQAPQRVFYGLRDEESKINLNAMNSQNYKVLSQLIVLLGFDEDTAKTIASSAADWHDPDQTMTNPPFGAEDNDYMSLAKPYHCKNLPFQNLEELLLVKGMTSQIYSKLKNYVTTFPQEASALLVNMNTAAEIVIRALARSMAGPITNTDMADADSMAAKVLTYRWGNDGEPLTLDDRLIDENEIPFNAKEKAVFLAVKNQTTNVSHYFRIHVKATDNLSGISSNLESVVYRDDLSIVLWHRN